MEVTIPVEARDSVGRALIATQTSALDALRSRVAELERGLAQARREIAGLKRAGSDGPWE